MSIKWKGKYADYLRTPHWKAMRDMKLERADWQCERCGEFGRRRGQGVVIGLHVHHLTYARLGEERMDDLEVLCIYCHECEHGRNKRSRDQIRAALAAPVLEYYDEDAYELEQWDLAEEARL